MAERRGGLEEREGGMALEFLGLVAPRRRRRSLRRRGLFVVSGSVGVGVGVGVVVMVLVVGGGSIVDVSVDVVVVVMVVIVVVGETGAGSSAMTFGMVMRVAPFVR